MLLDDVAWLSGLKGGLNGTEDLDLHLLLCLYGLCAHVGEEDAVVHLDETLVDLGFCWVDVQAGAAELSGVEGLDEGLFVDDATTGSVDEDGAVLHLVELSLAEALFGVLVEGEVKGDDVGLSEEFFLRLDVGARGICVGVGVTIVVDDLHVECSGALGEGGTDTSHTDNAEGLSLGVVGGLQARLPLARTSVDLSTVVLTQAREDEEHGSVGGGIVNGGRGVRDGNASCLCSVDVDLVVSSTVVADRLEGTGELVDKLSVKDTNLVGRVVVTVDGNNVGVLATGRAGLEEFCS